MIAKIIEWHVTFTRSKPAAVSSSFVILKVFLLRWS